MSRGYGGMGLVRAINTAIGISRKEFDTSGEGNNLRNHPQYQSIPWIIPKEQTALSVLRLFSDRPVLANENIGRYRTELEQYSQAPGRIMPVQGNCTRTLQEQQENHPG